MCNFLSLVSDPSTGDIFYADWAVRQMFLAHDPRVKKLESPDSHSSIASFFGYRGKAEDKLNKYEYNPFTKKFQVDQIICNGEDDSAIVEAFCRKLDFKKIIPALIIKPVVNPFKIKPPRSLTKKEIDYLWAWASVRSSVRSSVRASAGDSVGESVWGSVWDFIWDSVGDSVGDSVWDSVWVSVWGSVGDSVWDSVRDSVGASVWDSIRVSVRDSVGAYISSCFNIKYSHDFSPAVKLWERGLVPSYDGKTWRLHGGSKGEILYEKKLRGIHERGNKDE